MKVKMRFTKTGTMKFIGHLDCMRFFQKAMRRAKMDIAYSQGYSPHQLMSFASPLGVGVTSDGEYMDAVFHSLPDMELEELTAYLNNYMTEEIFVTGIEILPDTFKNSMSLLCAADYMVVEKEGDFFPENYTEKWEDYICQPEIIAEKKTKKSVKDVDLKPHILQWAFSLEKFENKTKQAYGVIHCPYEGNALYLQLTSGSEVTIKPELVMESFFRFCKEPYLPHRCQVHRMQMYFKSMPERKMQS